MPKILKVHQVGDFARYVGAAVAHPLVCAFDYAQVSPVRHCLCDYEVYGIFLHKHLPVELTYGRGQYAHDEGEIICVAPGQLGGKEDNEETVNLEGLVLLFHPDILRDSPLQTRIRQYPFFSYQVNFALHCSETEYNTLALLLRQIMEEQHHVADEEQDRILVALIEVLLHHCMRCYHRQAALSAGGGNEVLARFEQTLQTYFDNRKQLSLGLPTVQYCAEQVCMAYHYFSDYIKQTTGETASQYIHRFIIRRAKEQLIAGAGIAEVAYDLGFSYPQHFSRFFKQQTGTTPKDYLKSLNNS
ncbi:MAG: helix-turn-helix domain-containing protein [Paludibacteraceae bacterium]